VIQFTNTVESDMWVDYTKETPPEGVYEWRMPSVSLAGEHIIVAAKMRWRGSGYDKCLSPNFDHWDGYRVRVPAGLQWRPVTCDRGTPIHADLICVEGLEHSACIYCGESPKLNGCQRSNQGGVFINGDPWHFNSWWLSCCQWGHTPHLSDPREIERIRREAIDRAVALREAESVA